MNKIYKTLWNPVRRSLVVVSEAKASTSQKQSLSQANVTERSVKTRSTFKRTVLSTVIALLPFATLSFATSANAESYHNEGSDILVVGTLESGARPLSGKKSTVISQLTPVTNVTGVQGGVFINNSNAVTLLGTQEYDELTDNGTVWVGGLHQASDVPSRLILGDQKGEPFTIGRLIDVFVGMSPENPQHRLKGELQVRNGGFHIRNLTNADRVSIEKDTAALAVGKLTMVGNGVLTNKGEFTAESIQTQKGSGSAEIINDGDMKIHTGEVNVFKNNGTMSAGSLTMRNGGSVNAANARLEADDLTIAGESSYGTGRLDKGTLLNDGELTATLMTVDGMLDNRASSVVDHLKVSKDAIVENEVSGTLLVQNATSVGRVINNGQMAIEDEGKLESLTNAGFALINRGQITNFMNHTGAELQTHEDVSLQGVNEGRILSEGVLRLEQFTNMSDGELISNGKVLVHGPVTNQDGRMTVDGDIEVKGGETAQSYLHNKGMLKAHSMTLTDDGQLFSDGDVLLDRLSVKERGLVTVAGGLAHVGELSFAGEMMVTKGGLKADSAMFNAGRISLGNIDELAENNMAYLEVLGATTLNAEARIQGNGHLALGSDKDFGPSLGLEALPMHPARVTVGQTVTVGENGSLSVGSQAQYVATEKGNLFFGADSTTLVDASSLGVTPAFTTSVNGAAVTIENGAKLVLGNLEKAGDYVIADHFDVTGNIKDGVWAGGWSDDNLYALPQNGSGLGWLLSMHQTDDSLWVNVKLESISNLYPNIVIGDIVNGIINDPDRQTADNSFVNGVLTDTNHDVTEKTKVINSVAEIGLTSNALALAFNDLNTVTNSVENRVSMMGEVFNSEGLMTRAQELEKGHGLWVDLLHSEQKVDGYKASGNALIGLDASSSGFVMGYDKLLANNTTILGGTVSYQKGDADSRGNLLKSQNDYRTMGIHGYAAYSPSSLFNLVGSMSYLRSQSEATMGLPFGEIDKAKADIDTNLFTAGIRAESTMKLTQSVKLVPHAGVRVVYADDETFTTKLDGKTGFKNETDASTVVQFPVGVALRMDRTLDNGWTVRPHADVTFVAQTGDKEQSILVTDATGIANRVTGDVMGNHFTQASLGLQAQKGMTTVGVHYGATLGENGKEDHNAKLLLRLNF